MNKKVITALAVSALLSVGAVSLNSQSVNAVTTMRVIRRSYVYSKYGERAIDFKLHAGDYVRAYNIKRIHGKTYYRIGRNAYVRLSNVRAIKHRHKRAAKNTRQDNEKYSLQYDKNKSVNLDNNPSVPDAKSLINNADQLPAGTTFKYEKDSAPEFKPGGNTDVIIDVTYPDGSTDQAEINYTYYGTDHLKLPEGYTREEVQASEDSPTSAIIAASKKGNKLNVFVPESKSDDEEKVDIFNLTDDQKSEISNFALRIINEAREQVGADSWHYDADTQSLADDVADEYQSHQRNGSDGHYVAGLVRAAAKHGYDIQGVNQIEDIDSSTTDKPKTMTDLKELVYNGVLDFLFNGYEYHHACDILSTHQKEYWNENTENCPFAVSFTRVGGWNSVHYISVPANVINPDNDDLDY